MSSQDNEVHLRRFQDYGDVVELRAHLVASGRSTDYQEAVSILSPVFEALGHGEYPDYERLDQGLLQEHRQAVTEVVGWMADSPKADLRSAAITLMGMLMWQCFIPRLERSFSSEAEWERRAAKEALARVKGSE